MLTIQKPVRRTIEFIDPTSDAISFKTFNLPFPYVVFKSDYHNETGSYLSVGFCNEYPNDDTDVYFPPLSNLYSSAQNIKIFNYACITRYTNDDIHDKLVSEFWQSSFKSSNNYWFGDYLLIKKFYRKEIKEPFENYAEYSNVIFEALTNWSKLDLNYVWTDSSLPFCPFAVKHNTCEGSYLMDFRTNPLAQKIAFKEFAA